MTIRAFGATAVAAVLAAGPVMAGGGSPEGAVSACQTHVERLLKEAAETSFTDRRVQVDDAGKVEIIEKIRTVDVRGKERTGGYTCLATPYTQRVWGTKTSLSLTK